MSVYNNSILNSIFDNYYSIITKMYFYWMRNKGNSKLIYMWQGMKEKDKSFFRYKTIIHWFKEIYRIFLQK